MRDERPTSPLDAETWRREEPDSPCVRICAIHPRAQICVGCYRRLEEIAGWRAMSTAERAALNAELPARAKLLHRRRARPPAT